MRDARQCRDCGEEYRPDAVEITTCVECGGPIEACWLDESGEGEEEPPAEEATPGQPPADHTLLHYTPDAPGIVPLADRLQAAGLPFRLCPTPGCSTRMGLYVPQAELARARELLGDVELRAPSFEDFDAEAGYGRCPACSCDIPRGAKECPDCGLIVASSGECPQCGSVLPPGEEACPRCGKCE